MVTVRWLRTDAKRARQASYTATASNACATRTFSSSPHHTMDKLRGLLASETASKGDVYALLEPAARLRDMSAKLSALVSDATQTDGDAFDMVMDALRKSAAELIDYVEPQSSAEHGLPQNDAEFDPNQVEFRVGDRFSNFDAVKLSTDVYYRVTGFKLAVTKSWRLHATGVPAVVVFGCRHSGSPGESRSSGRLGCTMSVTFKRPKDSVEFVVTECSTEHAVPHGDHPPAKPPTLSREQELEFRRITQELSGGLRLCHAMRASAAILGPHVSTAERRALRNRIDAENRASRLNSKDYTDLEDLLAAASQDSSAVVKLVTDEGAAAPADGAGPYGAVIGVVLSSEEQLGMLRQYGDVLLVDTTYNVLAESSHAYNVFSVVVVTRHKRNFTCVHVLIANEQAATYRAVFHALKALIDDVGLCVRTVISDGAASMRNSLADVFPGTTLLTCRFHKRMNYRTHVASLTKDELVNMAGLVDTMAPRFELGRKVQGLSAKDKAAKVREALAQVFTELVYECETPEQFIARLDSLLAALPAGKKLGKVFDNPADFVHAYTRRTYSVGESTTSRAESENSALKHWIGTQFGRRITLKEFYGLSKERTGAKLQEQSELDCSSASVAFNNGHIRALRGVVSNDVLGSVFEDVVAVTSGKATVQTSRSGVTCKFQGEQPYTLRFPYNGPPLDCSCGHYDRVGFVCRHVVAARILGYQSSDGRVSSIRGSAAVLTAADFTSRWLLPDADAATSDDEHVVRHPLEALNEVLRSAFEGFSLQQLEVLSDEVRAYACRVANEHRSGAAVLGRGLVQVAATAPGRPTAARREALRRDPSEFEHREREAAANDDAERVAEAGTRRTTYRCRRCHQHGHAASTCTAAAECSSSSCSHRSHSNKRPRHS
jgi:hypothetical protein